MLVFAEGIHREKEAVVAIRHKLPLAREVLQRFAFENAFRAGEVVENTTIKDEKARAD